MLGWRKRHGTKKDVHRNDERIVGGKSGRGGGAHTMGIFNWGACVSVRFWGGYEKGGMGVDVGFEATEVSQGVGRYSKRLILGLVWARWYAPSIGIKFNQN